MNIRTLLLIIIIIVVLYYLVRWLTSDPSSLTVITPGTQLTTVDYSSLTTNPDGSIPSNFTYSLWFYVNDWNYRYGEPKVLFGRMNGTTSSSSSSSVDGVSGDGPCPLAVLGAITNDLNISMTVFPGTSQDYEVNSNSSSVVHTCSLQNVPIQKWVNLLVSVYGRTLDVYLDGKLVKTCVLPGIAKVNNNSNVYITPKGGFSGWTSRFQYFPNATDPQTAWNIYQKGPGGNGGLSNTWGKYQVKVSVIDNGTETNSFTI